MEKTLRELAEYLHGTLENEDQKLIVTGVNGLVEAGYFFCCAAACGTLSSQ